MGVRVLGWLCFISKQGRSGSIKLKLDIQSQSDKVLRPFRHLL